MDGLPLTLLDVALCVAASLQLVFWGAQCLDWLCLACWGLARFAPFSTLLHSVAALELASFLVWLCRHLVLVGLLTRCLLRSLASFIGMPSALIGLPLCGAAFLWKFCLLRGVPLLSLLFLGAAPRGVFVGGGSFPPFYWFYPCSRGESLLPRQDVFWPLENKGYTLTSHIKVPLLKGQVSRGST